MNKSRQRDLILSFVIQSMNHPSAEEVYLNVKEILPNISLGTVYRNLNTLADNGYIRRITVKNSHDRFDKTLCSHYHIRCVICDKVNDIFSIDDDSLYNNIIKETGFTMVSKDLVFEGICKDCKEEGELKWN